MRAIPTDLLALRARGRSPKLSGADLAQHRRELDLFERQLPNWQDNPGSFNIGPTHAGIAKRHDLLAEMARQWRLGLYGAEMRSPGQYTTSVLECLGLGLALARAAGAETGAEDIRLALRAAWALEALVAIPVARHRITANLAGTIASFVSEGGPGKFRTYEGLSLPVAGMRVQANPGKWKWMRQQPMGELLAWVIDAPRWRKRGAAGEEEIFPILAGGKRYREQIAAEVFGITVEERLILQRVVLEADAVAAREITAWLAPFGTRDLSAKTGNPADVWAWQLLRTADGVQVVNASHWPNGMKPPHAAGWVRKDGSAYTIRPGYGAAQKGGVWGYQVEILPDGRVVATVDAGQGERVEMEGVGGTPLWEVWIRGGVTTFRAGEDGPVEVFRRWTL